MRFEKAASAQRAAPARPPGREAPLSRFRSGRGTSAPAVRRRALLQAQRARPRTARLASRRLRLMLESVEGEGVGQDPDRRGQCAEHQAVLRPARGARPPARSGDRQPQRARCRARASSRSGDHRHPAAACQRARPHPDDPRRRSAAGVPIMAVTAYSAQATKSGSAPRARRLMSRSRSRSRGSRRPSTIASAAGGSRNHRGTAGGRGGGSPGPRRGEADKTKLLRHSQRRLGIGRNAAVERKLDPRSSQR